MSPQPRAETAADLWQLLEVERGLQPESYDDELVADMRKRLGLGAQPMAQELSAAGISMEQFLAAFFDAAAPYVQMWIDLLRMFEAAGATAGDENVDIAYRFDEAEHEIHLNLDHFRRSIAVAQQVRARFDVSGEHYGSLWRIKDVFDPVVERAWDEPPSTPELGAFVEACRGPDSPWPTVLPSCPTSPDPRLNQLLAEAWALAALFLDGVRTISESHGDLQASRDDSDAVVTLGATARHLRHIASDYWLSTTIAALVNGMALASGGHEEETADRLEDALAGLRGDGSADVVSRLLEFLSLPLWQLRHELYSNWVCCQFVAAIDDRQPRVHADRGTIKFEFSGTHLASFDGFVPRLHLWTELRSPLNVPAVGKGRKDQIQPDMTILADPITARRVPLAVECKQYRKANNKSFANALTDYTRGHEEAVVILVNYGQARAEAVLPLVDDASRHRARVVSDFRPGRPESIATFRREVRAALSVAGERPGSEIEVASVTLSWGAVPRDLDLHVFITSEDGTQHHVHFEDRGILTDPPFCLLEQDVTTGHGPERVTIARWLPATYGITVRNYSLEAPLVSSGAVVDVEIGGSSVTFSCPVDDPDLSEWSVCLLDGWAGRVI